MIRPSNLLCWATVLVGLLVVETSQAAKVDELELLCTNQRVSLTSLSQLDELAKSVGQDDGDHHRCPENIQEAIKSLVSLIRNDANHDLCSQHKADEILAFYREVDFDHLHKDLRKLYLAYGLKVSSLCRKSMVDELITVIQSGEFLTEDDLNEINKWTDEKSPIAKLLSDPSDYEDLIVPKYVIKMMKARDRALKGDDDDQDHDEKLRMFMQTSTNGTFASIKSICRRKFKPIYDELIAPLVTLSSVGLNYKGDKIEREDNINRKVFQWYRIVFMCETLSNVDILEDPEDPDRGKIRVFTVEEARSLFGPEVVDGKEQQATDQIKYKKPELHASIGDQLLDLNDKHLVKAIKKHKEPSDRLSSRLNLKLVSFVLGSLKSKAVKVFGRLTAPFRRNKGGPKKSDESRDVVKFFEEFKSQIEKKNEPDLSNTKLDRYFWKPLRVAVNVALIALFFLTVFALIIGLIAFVGHIVGVAVAPLAIGPLFAPVHITIPNIGIPMGAMGALGI